MTATLRDRTVSIGADPRDTADERFRKRLLVGVALIILPVGFVWGCLYWVIGEHEVAPCCEAVVGLAAEEEVSAAPSVTSTAAPIYSLK